MSRDTTQLHPRLQAKIIELKAICEAKGLMIGVSECVRTVSEQDALYAQGRTKPGKIVTQVKGSSYGSMHQWATAFDFYRNDGKGAFNNSDGFFYKVGKIGRSIGLEWGGDWKFKDLPHFQLPDWGSNTGQLKAKYKTPEVFAKSWVNHKGVYKALDTLTLKNHTYKGAKVVIPVPKNAQVACAGIYEKKGNQTYLYVTYKGKAGFIVKTKLGKGVK